MLNFNTLDDFDVKNKTVLLRVDFNLPLNKETLEILDDTRIKQALPTIKELMEKKAKTVVLAHQGRPGSWDFISLDKHARVLSNLLGEPVFFVNDVYGEKAKEAIVSAEPGDVVMLDNVRKAPEEMEKKSAEEHAKSKMVINLAPLADLFVNDAFAAAHRKQCSLLGFTVVLPSCAGRLLEKELVTLGKLVSNPEKPSVFIFGGAKYSDVVKTIERSLRRKIADEVILTGLPANAFLKAKGFNLGEVNENTLKEEEIPELMSQIKKLNEEFDDSIKLPVDFAVEKNGERVEIKLNDLPVDYPIYDIGSASIKMFTESIKKSKTIFISGPCGVFEKKEFMKGTKEVLTAIAEADGFSIVGGGHTVAAVDMLGLNNRISHISTGGGSLEKFMMGESLPVVEALKAAKK
ncbi:MAG TPA: phosphoglycerate kinase [Thermoplasmatales archaeon]|nr:phosphoglycerate kinase [Thermoplasmatales archaeon]